MTTCNATGRSPRALTPGRPSRPSPARGARGFVAIEALLVGLLLLVAMQAFAQVALATARQRATNRENAIAADAARSLLEHMRALPFADVFATYDADPSDDPGGAGTAPGAHFRVEGLTPLSGAPGGAQGTVELPVDPAWPGVLREDLVDRSMGLPRDLDGDAVIDGADHSGDYSILPVRVRIEWRGRVGRRELTQYLILTEMEP